MAINLFCQESEADLDVFAVSALVLYFHPVYFELPLEWAFHRGPPGYNSGSDLPKLRSFEEFTTDFILALSVSNLLLFSFLVFL